MDDRSGRVANYTTVRTTKFVSTQGKKNEKKRTLFSNSFFDDSYFLAFTMAKIGFLLAEFYL